MATIFAGKGPDHRPATPIRTVLTLAGLGIGILLLAYARFNAMDGVVLPFLQMDAHPGLYRLDHALTHSMVPASSIVFALLARWHADLTTPLFILPTYLLVTAVAGLGVWRLLGRGFGVDDPLLRAGLLFALALADFKFIGLNKSGWLNEHNFSLTFLACALRFWFLAFLLEGRLVAMAALLIPINILSFKVGWPASGMALLMLLIMRSRSPAAWGLLVASLVVPAWAALHAPHLAPGEAAPMFAALKTIYPAEDNPFGGPAAQFILFPAAMMFSLWALRWLPRDLAGRVSVVLLGSLAIWLVGGLYLTLGGRFLPLPMAVLLSPARGLELGCFVMYLLILLWIARAPELGAVERALLALAMMMLKVTPDGKWIKLPLLIALAALVVFALRKLAERGGLRFFRRFEAITLSCALAVMAPLIGVFFALNLSGLRTAYRYDPVIGFYDAAIPPPAHAMLDAIAHQPGDRRILFVWQHKDWAVVPWNPLARKSGINGDPYYMPNLADLREQRRESALADAVVDGVKHGRIDAGTTAGLASLNTTLAVQAHAASAAPGWRKVADYGGWVELAPPSGASAPAPPPAG